MCVLDLCLLFSSLSLSTLDAAILHICFVKFGFVIRLYLHMDFIDSVRVFRPFLAGRKMVLNIDFSAFFLFCRKGEGWNLRCRAMAEQSD